MLLHIDRKAFLEDIFEGNIILPCSYCGGKLIFESTNNKPVVNIQDNNMVDLANEYDDNIEYGLYLRSFCCVAKCRNCDKYTSIAGKSTSHPCQGKECITAKECIEYYYDSHDPSLDYDDVSLIHFYHKIEYIYPTPEIIPIDYLKGTKFETLIDILKESFSLYWIDEKACANRFGSAVESFEKISNIKGYHDNRYESLIEKLKTLHDVRDAGSHYDNRKISREQLLSAFEVFNLILFEYLEIYNKYKDGIEKKAKALRWFNKN